MNIRIITLAIVTLLVQNAWAQNTFKAIVKDGKNKEILIGVNAVLNKTYQTYQTECNILHSVI